MMAIESKGAPNLEFSNLTGTGFAGFEHQIHPEFRPDLPDLE